MFNSRAFLSILIACAVAIFLWTNLVRVPNEALEEIKHLCFEFDPEERFRQLNAKKWAVAMAVIVVTAFFMS